jgi:hypothetical protein
LYLVLLQDAITFCGKDDVLAKELTPYVLAVVHMCFQLVSSLAVLVLIGR